MSLPTRLRAAAPGPTFRTRAPRAATPTRLAVAAIAVAALAGCATTAVDHNYAQVQQFARERLHTDAQWLTTDATRRQAKADVDAALAKPLAVDDAVRIALAYNPAVQAAFAQGAADSAHATQAGRLPNPVFQFERLLRGGAAKPELEINRMLTLPVLDLLLLPAKARWAENRQQVVRLQLATEVAQAAADARVNWVRAVAAQQSLGYEEQVKTAADASADLARQLQQVGNFTKLQRDHEQAFYAEAQARLAQARLHALAAREMLARTLGLDAAQAARLQLPDRLPDLPAQLRDEHDFTQAALDSRLDVTLAKARLRAVARQQGLTRLSSVVNGLSVGAERNSASGQPAQRGLELDLPLPLFDAGDAARAGAQATYMAALSRAESVGRSAASQAREAYATYRSTYDIARQYRDHIVPLRKAISDENLLRYNGMLIGVFDLLADAREQIASVQRAIEAQRDFWLADAGLQAALIGQPDHSSPFLIPGAGSFAGRSDASGADAP